MGYFESMPHSRDRYLAPLLKKSLKFWPVVCLAGARQVGKSTFLKSLKGYDYSTLDDLGLLNLATRNPAALLTPPCVIDEAQKAPELFDAVKLDVDEKRVPGKFILTGSVRFSKRTLIRESLTGRAKTLQLFPFMCSEALELPFQDRWSTLSQRLKIRVQRSELERCLLRGGMPGVFAVRNPAEVRSYWKSLIESYVYRDLLFSIPKNAQPQLALKILKSVAEILALGESPTFARILRKTGGSRTQVQKHLIGLEDLMVLYRIPHWDSSPTLDQFLPFDSALFLALLDIENPQHDLAVHQACLQIQMLNELMATQQVTDQHQTIYYAESPQGQKVQLITQGKKNQLCFVQLFEEPIPHDYDVRFLKAQAKKLKGQAIALTSTQKSHQLPDLLVLPWEQVL